MADGLFGPSPWEVQQQQYAAQDAAAQRFAEMNATQRGVAGMHQAGGMLAGLLAEKFGGVNVPMQQAQRAEQIMGAEGTDLNSSRGLFAKADQFRKAGDLRTAAALTMRAQKLKRQEQSAALAQQKQDFQENDLMEFKRLQLTQAAELKQAQLAQAAEAARMRSEDTRLGIEARRDAAHEANQLRLQIAQLAAATKAEKSSDGMTPAQRGKLAKESRDALANTLNIDNETAETIAQIKLVQQHEGGAAATGPIAGRIGNWRESTVDYENQLEGAKGKLTKIAKDLMSESGKIGSMQVQEWQILLNTIAAINPKMGQKNINIALDNVVADLERKRDVHYAKLQQKYGSEEAPIEKPTLKVPQKSSQYVKGGATATGELAAADKFVVGKQYKDAKGNVATYLGNGKWK